MSELSLVDRSQILNRVLAEEARKGWRIVYQGDTQAQLLRGAPLSHVLHLILTLVTFGLWAIVWLLLIVFGGEKQRFVSVDERGVVSWN